MRVNQIVACLCLATLVTIGAGCGSNRPDWARNRAKDYVKAETYELKAPEDFRTVPPLSKRYTIGKEVDE